MGAFSNLGSVFVEVGADLSALTTQLKTAIQQATTSGQQIGADLGEAIKTSGSTAVGEAGGEIVNSLQNALKGINFSEPESIVKEGAANIGESLASILPIAESVSLGAVAAIAAIGGAAVKAGSEFEVASDTIRSRTGAIGSDLDGLMESFHGAFAELPQSAGEIAESLSLIKIRLGDTGEQLTEFTTQIGQLAHVTGEQLQPLTDAVTKAFQNWSISTEDQTTKLNLLFAASQQSGVSVSNLAGQIAQVGVSARAAGEDFNTTAARIAYLSQQGIDAQAVYQGLERAQARLVLAGSDAKITLDDLVRTIAGAKTPARALSESVELLGSRLGPRFAELITSGKLSVDSFKQSIENSKTSITDTYKETENFEEKWTKTWHAVAEVLEPVGGFILDFLKGTADDIKIVVEALQSLWDKLAGGKQFAGDLADTYKKADDVAKALGVTVEQLTPQMVAQYNATQQVSKGTFDAAAATSAFGSIVDTTAVQVKNLKDKHVDVAAAMEQAKAAEQAQKDMLVLLADATKLAEDAEKSIAETRKASSLPSVMAETDAEKLLNDARQYAKDAAAGEEATLAALNAERNKAHPSAAALVQLENDLAVASRTSADAREEVKGKEEGLAAARKLSQAAQKELADSESAHAEFLKATTVPVLLDYQTALAAVNAAKAQAVTSDQALTAAEAVYNAAVKSGDPKAIADATLALHDARAKLKGDTDAEKTAEDNLKQSQDAVAAATKELASDDRALDDFYTRELTPHLTDLKGALDLVRQAKADAAQAYDNLRQKVADLDAAITAEGTATQHVKDLTGEAAAARQDFTNKTKDLHDIEQKVATDLGVSKQALDDIKPSTDAAAKATQDLEAALSAVGIDGPQKLAELKRKTDDAYDAMVKAGNYAGEEWVAKMQAALHAAEAVGNFDLAGKIKAQLDDYRAEIARQEELARPLWSTLKEDINGAIDGVSQKLGELMVDGKFSLKNVGEAFEDAFKKVGVDAISYFIQHGLQALLDALGNLLNNVLPGVSSALGGIFSKVPTSIATPPISTTSGIPGIGGAGSAVQSGAASVLSGAMSILNPIGAIGSAISAVTGILSLFGVGQGGQKDRLNNISDATKFLAWVFDDAGGGGHAALLNIQNALGVFVSGFFTWYKDWCDRIEGVLDDESQNVRVMTGILKSGITVSGVTGPVSGGTKTGGQPLSPEEKKAKELQGLQDQIASWTDSLHAAQDKLQADKTALQPLIDGILGQIQVLEQEQARSRGTVNNQAQIDALTANLAVLESVLSKDQADIDYGQTQIAQLQQQLYAKDPSKLQDALTAMTAAMNVAQADLANKTAAFQPAIDSVANQIAALKEQAARSRGQLSEENQAQLDALSAELDVLTAARDQATQKDRDDIAYAQAQIALMQAQLDTLLKISNPSGASSPPPSGQPADAAATASTVAAVFRDMSGVVWGALQTAIPKGWFMDQFGDWIFNNVATPGSTQQPPVVNMQGNVYLDSQEMFASFVKWIEDNGLVLPQSS